MLTLWWVRHGPTHRREMIGWTDVPADLTDTARLERLAAALSKDAPVISSDLLRARTTADAIQGARHRLPHDPDLREMHFGQWEGRSYDDVSGEDAALSRSLLETPGDVAPPAGESWNELAKRVGAAVGRLTSHRGDLVVVAHFGPILTQVQRARHCTASDAFSQRIEPLSVTRLRWDGAHWHEEQTNHQP
jgi:broad specificity phosphatase PhoE